MAGPRKPHIGQRTANNTISVIARAVAPMQTLAEYLLPFANAGGYVIAMKGVDAQAETTAAEGAINKLGGELVRIENVTLPNRDDKRALVVLRKTRPTPKLYPRQGGAPRKYEFTEVVMTRNGAPCTLYVETARHSPTGYSKAVTIEYPSVPHFKKNAPQIFGKSICSVKS